MSNWTVLCDSLASEQKHTEKVLGNDINFYPVTAVMLFKLKDLFVKGSSVITKMQNSESNLKTVVSRDTDQGELSIKEIVQEAPTAESLTAHTMLIEKGWQELIEYLMGDNGKVILGEMLMVSMRDVFAADERANWPTPSKFMDSIPLTALPTMLLGLFKAHKEVLGPMSGKLENLIGQVVPLDGTTTENSSSSASTDQEQQTS